MIRSGEFDQVGERSQFESPILDALSEEGCVQFQYNIAGSDNDWLNVYVEDYWTGNQSCMWHKNGSTVPNRWMTAEAPLKLEKDGKYLIAFEARKGEAGGMGLVSIDHIVISPTACSGTYPVEECPFEEVIIATTMMATTEGLEVITTAATITPINTTVTSSPTLATVTKTPESTIEMVTTDDGEQNRTTTVDSGSKNTLILAIVFGVLGGVIVVSAVAALFIWHSTILNRLGIKQSNRVRTAPTYQAASGGTVQINGTTNDNTNLL
ncbi:unnamed protein product [Rotaria sp. Silwood1]|nr:unnamed protein product [Rotaria sp. Silwood1]